MNGRALLGNGERLASFRGGQLGCITQEPCNRMNAIKFMDYVIEKFPFRIHTIRADRGHEFQDQFHWHVYIRPHSPELNGKVERSHRSDQEEFYQLLAIPMMWIWR
jgi:hypothetical protein